MENLIRLLAIVVFLGILISLGSALFHLSRGGKAPRTAEDSRKMARALTWRVALSLALFLLLLLAAHFGLISPNVMPGQ